MTSHQLFVRLSLLIAAICAVFLMIGGAADANTPAPPPIEHVVEAGDTLWGVATQHATPGSDIRRLVRDIKTESNLVSGTIFPGQILLIPAA